VALLAVVALVPPTARAQGQAREFTINGNQFAFSPARIEVQKDDLVQITFSAKDIAHSFTVDPPYRISKRAGAGQSDVFEFGRTRRAASRSTATSRRTALQADEATGVVRVVQALGCRLQEPLVAESLSQSRP
jgi:hypothetical protein